MNRNNLINQIVSRIDDKFDGDTVLFVEQYLEAVLREVSRMIVYSGMEARRDLLATSVPLSKSTATDGRLYVDISTQNFIYNGDKLEEVIVVADDDSESQAQPVNNWFGLDYLPTLHDYSYYKLHQERLWIGSHTGTFKNVTITHYKYLDATDFPENLIDMVVQGFEKYISGEYQKQKVEDNEKERGVR